MVNDHLLLVCGEATSGKSASLMNIKNPEGVLYLNCEAGKKLPFKNKFKRVTITDPNQILTAFDQAEQMEDVHTIVIDSLTYMMDMYETCYIYRSTNGQAAWQDFQQFFKILMQQKVAASKKMVIFTAHTLSEFHEASGTFRSRIPIKGALKGAGIESFFSMSVTARILPLTELEDYKNDMLTITPQEEVLGVKHVFQTQLTRATVGDKIRAPMGMWEPNETYIDNDVNLVSQRIHEYYVD